MYQPQCRKDLNFSITFMLLLIAFLAFICKSIALLLPNIEVSEPAMPFRPTVVSLWNLEACLGEMSSSSSSTDRKSFRQSLLELAMSLYSLVFISSIRDFVLEVASDLLESLPPLGVSFALDLLQRYQLLISLSFYSRRFLSSISARISPEYLRSSILLVTCRPAISLVFLDRTFRGTVSALLRLLRFRSSLSFSDAFIELSLLSIFLQRLNRDGKVAKETLRRLPSSQFLLQSSVAQCCIVSSGQQGFNNSSAWLSQQRSRKSYSGQRSHEKSKPMKNLTPRLESSPRRSRVYKALTPILDRQRLRFFICSWIEQKV